MMSVTKTKTWHLSVLSHVMDNAIKGFRDVVLYPQALI